MDKPQEQFRYNTQEDKDLVTNAYNQSKLPKARCHFVRNIVLRACRRLLKK